MIGIHGRLGSGKDTVLERLQVLAPDRFERVSFADPLKRSAAALLGVTVDTLERMKRDESFIIQLGHQMLDRGVEVQFSAHSQMTIREYLQRYGTEAHRAIFGDDFWVNIGIGKAAELYSRGIIPVFTDVRFENEALAILDSAGILNDTGEIWAVNGPVNDTGDHASETPLPVPMIDRFIDNTARDDAFAGLDEQLTNILADLHVGSRNASDTDLPRSNNVPARNGFLG